MDRKVRVIVGVMVFLTLVPLASCQTLTEGRIAIEGISFPRTTNADLIPENELETCEYSNIVISENGRLVHSSKSIFGEPDADNDGLNDNWENVMVNELNPGFILADNEQYYNHPEDNVSLFVRITPYLSTNESQYILFEYVMAWSRDYGKLGIGSHNGDTEPFIIVWRICDNYTLALDSLYVHAHEGCNERMDIWTADNMSCNSAGICDFTFESFSMQEICSDLEFYNNRILLYVSEDKHAIYPSAESCKSVILIQPSPSIVWTKPLGSCLNIIGTLISWYSGSFIDLLSDYHSGFHSNQGPNKCHPCRCKIQIKENCGSQMEDPIQFKAYNIGEPDHLYIEYLDLYGFPGEPISGRWHKNRYRFFGGRSCDEHGATPVLSWLSDIPEVLKYYIDHKSAVAC